MDSSAFLRQVSAVPLLGAEQEVDLALRMRVGASAARMLASGRSQPLTGRRWRSR
jgi:hypothetical protein